MYRFFLPDNKFLPEEIIAPAEKEAHASGVIDFMAGNRRWPDSSC